MTIITRYCKFLTDALNKLSKINETFLIMHSFHFVILICVYISGNVIVLSFMLQGKREWIAES